MDSNDLDQIFREELEQRSQRLVEGARALADESLDRDALAGLLRDAHTIKGSSGLMGRDVIREAAAKLESVWREVVEGERPGPEVIVAMEAVAGRLVSAFDTGDHDDLREAMLRLSQGSTDEGGAIPLRQPDPGSLGGLLTSVSANLMGGATRVDTSELYRLINRIVEVALDAEALVDLSLVSFEGSEAATFRRSWRRQLERLSRSVGDIQDQAVALANVTFFEAVSTFPQFIRYLGRRLGKDVRLELTGHDVALDRQIAELLREPLRHLVVNAVDHGIERPEQRLEAGKPSTGTVSVSARATHDGLEVVVSDDGAGVDWGRVAELDSERKVDPTTGDLSPTLFRPGVSTAKTVTDFSGAGDGLAIVAEAMQRVNGSISIDSEPGAGTKVSLSLPASMVLQNVVVIADDGEFWGLPEVSVEDAMPLSEAEIEVTASGRELKIRSEAIPVVSLSEAVGSESSPEHELLVVTTRHGLVGLTVGEVVDRRRVAVKNLGPILEGAGHITGAALLGAGEILVVLDPNFLGVHSRRRPRATEDRPSVLVVDDSAGVRQLLSATLTGAGFAVEVAGGAREAMRAMAGTGFDAMVVDYSMPRSNGVELVRAMRAADVRVPIVMVSGVASRAEKEAAWEVGVDAYLDKFDLRQGVLTKTLRSLLGLDEGESANG